MLGHKAHQIQLFWSGVSSVERGSTLPPPPPPPPPRFFLLGALLVRGRMEIPLLCGPGVILLCVFSAGVFSPADNALVCFF